MNDDHEHTELGVSPKEMNEGMMISSPKEDKEPEKVYPSFHYSGPTELHLPDEGKMEIHFRKVSETSSVRNGGKHWYECTVEVHCFGEVESDEPESPTSSDHSAEEALDTLAQKLMEKRNGNGNGNGNNEESNGNGGY